MDILVWTSPKGGVGKTTLALNTAFTLARQGRNVLLVETDPQGALGLSLSREATQRPGLWSFLWEQRSLASLMSATRMPNFRILTMGHVPALEIPRYEQLMTNGLHLARLVREASAHGFDMVIFDTPCGFSGATLGPLRVATHALSPLQAEPLATRAVRQLFEVIGGLRQQGAQVQLMGFVLTMLQHQSRTSYAIAQEIWSSFPPEYLLSTNIPRHPGFLDAAAAGLPIALAPDAPPHIVQLLDMLGSEIQARLTPTPEEHVHAPTSFLV